MKSKFRLLLVLVLLNAALLAAWNCPESWIRGMISG